MQVSFGVISRTVNVNFSPSLVFMDKIGLRLSCLLAITKDFFDKKTLSVSSVHVQPVKIIICTANFAVRFKHTIPSSLVWGFKNANNDFFSL